MPFTRARRFFGHDVWVENLDTLPGPRALFYRMCRVLYLAARGFMHDNGLHRASALAFDTVLGLIPFLAFIVAALKGFGSYDRLMTHTVRPWIEATLRSMGDSGDTDVVSLRTIFRTLLGFLDHTDFGALGILGLVALLYIAVLMLVSVEASMNHIFGAMRSRGVTRRISDYSAILFIMPVFGTLAAAVAAMAESVAWPAAGLVLQLASIGAMSFALAMMYIVMPFAKVRVRSAAIGAAVAGVFWYSVLLLHVHFQIGVARYNAIYSTFAAIPLFFIWVFLSWVVVLFGAEVTAAHQNPEAFRFRVWENPVDHSARQFVALCAMLAITDAFTSGKPLPNLPELARLAHAPDKFVEQVLDTLAERGLVAKAGQEGEPMYLPVRDVASTNVSAVLDALERSPSVHAPPNDSAVAATANMVLGSMRASRATASQNYTLRELMTELRSREAAAGDDESSEERDHALN
ncbi:MAG TPA: YhjD/YihY/BrkB family envelope integrity protein [Polyangiaceae bacterium]|nr:YhjD/YihY/BrkB family envelope integrity protein [Polyangiaceae bacterium]